MVRLRLGGRRSSIAAIVAAMLVLAACAGDDGTPLGDTDDASDEGATAWTHIGVVEATLPDLVAAEALTDEDALSAAWEQHGFEGSPPDVAFDDEVVLLLGRPDDACPDDLIGLEVADGELVTDWLAPPGPCEQPLILWLHAVQVHRGVLAESFSYGPSEPFEGELERVTLDLPPYDGDAPPAPEPPSAMGDDELDEVFAGHDVQRCGSEHRVGRGGQVDGPLSDDPEVAAAQQGRADHGLASDEASTREAMEASDLADGWGFPMLPSEEEAGQRASELIGRTMEALESAGWDTGNRMPGGHDGQGVVVPMIDRSDGVRAAVVVGPDDEPAVRELLDREIGEGEVAVIVDERWPPAVVVEAQAALTELMGEAGLASVIWVSGPPGPAQIGIVDPTRDDLDRIAVTVDPALVCVDVELSGIRPLPG